ncbi:MAG: alpha/beta fold hydrolase [Planctomycetota bacterium]|nr:alpha/beta fold hydrolase [Planctomycetota bacterium]MDA1212930.1 alpha/beta fold hydrolase [Planctomycetota bacterium]
MDESVPIWKSEYPFASHHLAVGGATMHYIDESPADETPAETLLMVHGNPTWSFAWRRLISALSPTCRVVVPDHIGCGLSEKPHEYQYRLAQHIDNLCELIEKLDLRNITLVAHDWGGAIGMGAAARLNDRISRIVLLNTAAFRSDRIPFRIAVCQWPIVGPIAVRGFNLFSRCALWMAVAKPERFSKVAKAGYVAPYDTWNNRQAVLRFVQDIPLSASHPSYAALEDVERGLEKFNETPMLFVWGEKDWCFTVDFLREFQRRFPHAETVSLPDAGHYVFEDAPEEVIDALQTFMTSHPLR